MEAPWQTRITRSMLEEAAPVHQIVADTRYEKKPNGTGAWSDSDVPDGYHCTRCGAQGKTHEQINQQNCQPVKG